MAAGTVISGGFPGRVAQEVTPNQKCGGCLHYDGQAGRTGACLIGERPWNCGDGDAQDIGYAPIAAGAGSYLPGMSNHGAHASEAPTQFVSALYGSGSTRPIAVHQVSLGEEHVQFVKSVLEQHASIQKSQCRLCSMRGAHGVTPPNVGYQLCTCAPIQAQTIAKALISRMSNAQRNENMIDDVTEWVHDVVKAGFKIPKTEIDKGIIHYAHGEYHTSPAGLGEQHVDLHPRVGEKQRIGTFKNHKEARRAVLRHADLTAGGSGKQTPSSSSKTIPAMPKVMMARGSSDVAKADEYPEARRIRLKKVHSFVKEHGFHTTLHDDHVKIHIPWKNTHTGESGTEVMHAQNMKQARDHLGY